MNYVVMNRVSVGYWAPVILGKVAFDDNHFLVVTPSVFFMVAKTACSCYQRICSYKRRSTFLADDASPNLIFFLKKSVLLFSIETLNVSLLQENSMYFQKTSIILMTVNVELLFLKARQKFLNEKSKMARKNARNCCI